MKFILYIAAVLILSIIFIGIPFQSEIALILGLFSPMAYLAFIIGLTLLIGLVIRLVVWN